jgi:peptidoglycan/LPS O-acetylase OafA/YrhL
MAVLLLLDDFGMDPYWETSHIMNLSAYTEMSGDLLAYFGGVLLAFILASDPASFNPTLLSRLSVSVTSLLSLGFALWDHAEKTSGKDLHQRTGMLPFQLLILYGCALEHDPLARLLARVPAWARDLSMGIYMMQVPAHDLVRNLARFVGDHVSPSFGVYLVTLLPVAVLSQNLVQKPVERALNKLVTSA